jgi:ribosomal protein S12 methylthiotransferase accessory factor
MTSDKVTTIENKFKDFKPDFTLAKIRDILNKLNVFTYETSWNNFMDFCYSVRVVVDKLPNVGMNGKSTSKIFALTSAYGELMERIQNKSLLNRKYGLKPFNFNYPDERELSFEEFKCDMNYLNDLITDFSYQTFEPIINKYRSSRISAPYLNMVTNEVKFLPSRFISFACGTNGMCAGNTEEEALVHGLAEIFERYVTREIVRNNLELPTIPISTIKTQKIVNALEYLKRCGYTVKIKDCTLGGKYPVVGLIVLNKAKTNFQLRLGSDPVFEIALERCLTEIFQGFSLNNFHKGLLPIEWDSSVEDINEKVEKICKDASKAFPCSVLFDKEAPVCIDSPFLYNYRSNKEGLTHFLHLLENEKREIYIRNHSFLGFPAFRIYVPGMTEIYLLSTESIQLKFSLASAAKYILNVNNCTPSELKELADILELSLKKQHSPIFEQNPIYRRMLIYLDLDCELRKLDLRLLLCLLNFRLSDYTKALHYFEVFFATINNKESFSNISYYEGVYAFLCFKAKGIGEEQFKTQVGSILDSQELDTIIKDLSAYEDLSKYLNLPSCPNCDICEVKNNCKFSVWETYSKNLNDKLNKYYNSSASGNPFTSASAYVMDAELIREK